MKKKFKIFWKEWGVSFEELEILIGALCVISSIFALYIIGTIFA